MNEDRISRVSANLRKLSIFLSLIFVALFYVGWFRLSSGVIASEIVWIIRIGSILVGYSALKCFFSNRYLNEAGDQG